MRVLFVDHAGEPGETLDLTPAQQQHLRAQRLRSGETLPVWDGQRLVQAKSSGRELHVVRGLDPPREGFLRPHLSLTVAIGATERHAREAILTSLTALGAYSVAFMTTDHTDPADRTSTEAWTGKERPGQIITAAAQQSGNLYPPGVLWLDRDWEEKLKVQGGWFGELPPQAHSGSAAAPLASPDNPWLWIGPPGGWSARELESLSHHAWPLTLGRHVLRSELAATALVAVLVDRLSPR